jgi:transposase-like protein
LSYKRDRKLLEQRRLQVVRLYRKGQTQYQIAKQLGVSFEAVSNWVELYKKRGLNGLKSRGKPRPQTKTGGERQTENQIGNIKRPSGGRLCHRHLDAHSYRIAYPQANQKNFQNHPDLADSCLFGIYLSKAGC